MTPFEEIGQKISKKISNKIDASAAKKMNVSEKRYGYWKDHLKTLPSRRKINDNPLMNRNKPQARMADAPPKINPRKAYQD